MVSNYLMLLAIGLALLLAAPLDTAWTSTSDGRMLGKRWPALSLQASVARGAIADAGAGVVLIDFATPWCVPCHTNVPLLNRLQRDYRTRGLTVVGMARAPPAQVVERAQRERRDYQLGSDADGKLFAQLGMNRLPAAVLMDRNGIVVWQGDPATLPRNTIERTLAAPALGEVLRF